MFITLLVKINVIVSRTGVWNESTIFDGINQFQYILQSNACQLWLQLISLNDCMLNWIKKFFPSHTRHTTSKTPISLFLFGKFQSQNEILITIPYYEQFILEETNGIYYSWSIYSNVRSYQLNGRVQYFFIIEYVLFVIQNDKSSILHGLGIKYLKRF